MIGYITSVYPPLRYHRVGAVSSPPCIIYMRSLPLFGYILQYKITPNQAIPVHVNTRYEPFTMNIYIAYF